MFKGVGQVVEPAMQSKVKKGVGAVPGDFACYWPDLGAAQ